MKNILLMIALAVLLTACAEKKSLPTCIPAVPVETKKPIDKKQYRKDCTAEAVRLCPDEVTKRDQKAVVACLVKQKEKISSKCYQHLR